MSDELILKEGEDFYYDEDGLMVMTKAYLLKKGHCCQSGCRHCPYGYNQKVDPNIPGELQPEWNESTDVYDGDIPEDME